jgi:leucyl aminopeptidase
MDVKVALAPLASVTADTIVVGHFAGVAAPGGAAGSLDRTLGGAITDVIASGDASGEIGATTVLYPRGAIAAARVLLVGLGPHHAFDADAARRAAASAARRARDLGTSHLASVAHGVGAGGLAVREAAEATVEGTRLGLYRYGVDEGVTTFTLVDEDPAHEEDLGDGARWGGAIADGVLLARDLVRRPPNVATPEHLAQVALGLAEDHGFAVTIGDRAWAEARGMGAFLAVAQAAGHAPRFIVLEHDPTAGREAPIVLVGKGVTFDSGGLSLKDRKSMETMKEDMAGAAAVLGAMHALGRLRSPRRVVALVPATENVVDAHGFRPTDVVRAANGLTVEIVSTDAEGRLLLADALVHAATYRPRAVVDVATLTGAVRTALGPHACGLFSNDDDLARSISASGERTRERTWRLPLWERYRDALASDVADMKNSAGQPHGGASVAAAFLERFTDYPWAHLDIAGVVSAERTEGYVVKGPSGFGVRLLVDWLTRGV